MVTLPVIRRVPCVPPFDLKVELETRFTNNLDPLAQDILRDIDVQLDHANEMFRELYRFACVLKYHSIWVSKQRLVIEATDLSNTFAPDDTCTFTSETDHEFNFIGQNADGSPNFRETWVRIGGMPPMMVVGNLDETLAAGYWNRAWNGLAYEWLVKQGLVWASGERTLVVRNWNAATNAWVPLAWDVGWTVLVWQIEPGGGWNI